jgi:hypothetical protein
VWNDRKSPRLIRGPNVAALESPFVRKPPDAIAVCLVRAFTRFIAAHPVVPAGSIHEQEIAKLR